MKRALLFALLVPALVVLATDMGSMQSVPRVPAELLASATEGPVRVIVQLTVPAAADRARGGPRAIAAERAALAEAQDAAIEQLPGLVEGVTRFENLPAFAVTTDHAGLMRLLELPSVRGVGPDTVLRPALTVTPGMIKADVLWGQGTEGTGWNIVVIDSGVERTHTFFGGRITAEACFSTSVISETVPSSAICLGNDPQAFGLNAGIPCTGMAECEHGTLVAGISSGRGQTFSGIARNSGIMSIKAMSRFTTAASCGTGAAPCIGAYTSDVMRALDYVETTLAGPANAGRVAAINLSLAAAGDRYPNFCNGTNATFLAFADAVERLRALGIPTVVSSGNGGDPIAMPFPACISNAISVGSVTKNDTISVTTNRNRLLDLYAPGELVISSTVNDRFITASGTSLAAPHVAGGWALLKERAPAAGVEEILIALKRTGVPKFETSNIEQIPRIVLDRAGGSLGPAGSPTAVLVNVTGSNVASTWEPPFDGTPAAGYHVEIVLASTGAPVAIINNGTSRSFTTTLPSSQYRLRVRTITGGGPGAASNEIPFTVGTPPNTSAPLPPRDLRAVVNGSTVTFSWNLPLESPAAISYMFEVGTAPGLTNIGQADTSSAAQTFTFNNVTPATFYVRIRARNAFGISGPSNEVTVTVGGSGCTAFPPTGLNATVAGALVTLNWDPLVLSGQLIGFRVEVGTAPGQSNVAQVSTGTNTILSGSAPPGIYYARVRSIWTCGISVPSNEVTFVVP